MRQDLNRLLREYLARVRGRKIWKNILSTLACVVVFCTVYALILPAITLEWEATEPVETTSYIETAVTEAPTEAVTEAPAEAPTEAVTEASSEAVTEASSEAVTEVPSATEVSSEAEEVTTENAEESTEDTAAPEEETAEDAEETEATEETEAEEEVDLPELEEYVTNVYFTDTVYDAAADHFDTVMHISFRVPRSVIASQELFACDYQLPGRLAPRTDLMWNVTDFYYTPADTDTAVKAGTFIFTFDWNTNRYLCVLDFDRDAIGSADPIEGFLQFPAEINRYALQEEGGYIYLVLSNGAGVSIAAPQMPETETTEAATEETTEVTTEETMEETTEETTEAATEEITEETTEETTEPTRENIRDSIKDTIKDILGDKLPLGGLDMGASNYEVTAASDGTEETEESTAADETDSTSKSLPVTKLSGNDTKYDPTTDLFTTKVRIDFQFNSTTGIPTADTVYTYTYPAGIVVPDGVVNQGAQDLYDGDKYAGTYQFIKNDDDTYSVWISFDSDYIDKAGDTVTGYVQFEGSFDKDDMNEEGSIVVGDDDATILVPGNDITYPKDETESYNISTSKSGTWERDGDKLVYTVYVRTTKGTPDPISLTDTMTIPDGLSLGNPTVAVEKGTSIYYYYDWEKAWAHTDQNDWTSVSDITPSSSDGKLTISLPKLTVTNGTDNSGTAYVTGDVYKITYTYLITDQTVDIVSVDNSVSVSATDSTKGQTVEDSDKTTVRVDKDFSHTLNKYGQIDAERPGYIKWTIRINDNEVDIAGATLTDLMLGDIQDTAKDIQITPNQYFEVTVEDGSIKEITFTEAENGVNENQYTITYYTPVEESWDGTTVTNTATFDPTPGDDGDEKVVDASITVDGVKMYKGGLFDGTKDVINWTITVNPGGLDIAGATLTDEMFAALSTNDFEIEPSDGWSFTYEGEDENQKITGITFSAVKDGKNTETYIITYSTPVTRTDGVASAVTNTAILSPGEGKDGKPIGSESTVKPDELQMTKSGSYDSYNQKINWTIDVNPSKLNIAGAELTDGMFIQLAPGDITVTYDSAWGSTANPTEYEITTTQVELADGTKVDRIAKITFKGVEDDSKNNKHYVITYSTPALQQWSAQVIHNEAKLTMDGKDVPSDTDVTVPASGTIEKSAGSGTIDGNTMTIPWTVTLNVPQGGLPAGTIIEDDVTKNQWNDDTNTNQWMTRTQITDWATNLYWKDSNGNDVGGTNDYTPPKSQVIFKASDGNTYTYEQISLNNGGTFDKLTYSFFRIEFKDNVIPPNGATKLTFTYSTTVDLAQATDGQNKFYNYVKAGDKESGAEYIYNKPYVVKMDGNGKTDTTSVSNEGSLTWKIKAMVGKGYKKLTLTDTLPEQVTLESLQITGGMNASLSVAENGSITGTDSNGQYKASGSYIGNVITLYIEPLSEAAEAVLQDGAVFNVTVNCKVINPSTSGSLTLTNEVAMSLQDASGTDTPIDSSKQTQNWTYDRQVVDKSGKWNNASRIMDYTIILNPGEETLAGDGETLTLVDTMSYTNQIWLPWPFDSSIAYSISADLMQSSVKLYKAVWNEETQQWEKGTEVTGWSWTYETKTGENSWDSNQATNTITATGIPDSTPLMLVYSYRVSSNVPESINVEGQGERNVTFDLEFDNKAKLEGTNHSDSSSSSNWKWEHSSSSAGVTTDKSYTFYKVEKGNYNVSLEGAVFSVYKYDTTDKVYLTDPVKTYTTDSSGSFHITRQEKDTSGNVTFTYDSNTLYKVVETAAPDGYWMPDVVNTYYFYFSSKEEGTPTLPNDLPAGAVDLSSEAKTVYVENVKNTTEISVEKVWKDANGNITTAPADSITINLYQRTTKTSGSGGDNISGSGESATVTATARGTDLKDNITPSNAITIGSKIQIKIELNYSLSSLEWRPSVSVTGMDVDSDSGWVLEDASVSDNHSTYTLEGTVTENVSVSIDENSWSIERITVTTLSQATTPTGPESGGDTTTEKVYKPITLPDNDGNWSCTVTGLPLKGLDKDNNTVSYYYYFQEDTVPDGYSVSYSNGSSGVQSGTVTVTNQKLPDTTSVKVNKVWKDASGNQIASDSADLPASIQVYLTRKIGEGTPERVDSDGNTGDSAQPYTVTKAAGWTLTIGDLLKTNEDGTNYTYSFEEVPMAGYTPTVTVSETGIVITNKETEVPTTSIEVKKEWVDSTGATVSAPENSITFDLYRIESTTQPEQTVIANGQGGTKVNTETLTITASSWTATVTDLPTMGTKDGTAVYYTYYVVETAVEGYDTIYSVNGSTITITNKKQPETTSITVKKVWGTGTDGHPDSITFDLYQLASGETSTDGKTPILSGLTVKSQSADPVTNGDYTITYGAWETIISNLPAKDSSGNAYTYYVVETYPTGYQVSYSNGSTTSVTGSSVTAGDNGTITITNTQTPTPSDTSLTVKKAWSGESNPPESITFELHQVAHVESGSEPDPTEPEETTEPSTDPSEPETTEYVTVYAQKVVYNTNPEHCFGQITVPVGSYVTVTFKSMQNSMSEFFRYYTNDQWNFSNFTATKIAEEEYNGNVRYTYSFTLQVNEETHFCISTYEDDQTTEFVSLTTTPGTASTSAYSLSRTVDTYDGKDVVYETCTITSADDWTKTFYDLPAEDVTTDGKKVTYTYYVVETAPATGYAVTYTNGEGTTSSTGSEVTTDANGSLTITNTKTTVPATMSMSVQKDWQNPDGTPMTENPYSATVQLKRVKAVKVLDYENKATIDKQYLTDQYTLIVSFDLTDASKANNCPGSICCGEKWDDHLALFTFSSNALATNYCAYNMAQFAGKTTDVHINFWGDSDDAGNEYATLNSCTLVKLPDNPEWLNCGDPVTLTGSNTQYTWTDLERMDSDGNYWIYTVEETEVKQGETDVTNLFTTTISPDNGLCNTGAFTITNKLNSVKVTKRWLDSSNTALTDCKYVAVVQLYQVCGETEKAYGESVKLTSKNGWSWTWNVPFADGSGAEYSYYVVETAVEGANSADITDKFTVTIDHGDKDNAVEANNEITITNKLNTTYTLPETGGGGTGFYRIGGSMLVGMAAAGLIGNTKKKKRKEADKPS